MPLNGVRDGASPGAPAGSAPLSAASSLGAASIKDVAHAIATAVSSHSGSPTLALLGESQVRSRPGAVSQPVATALHLHPQCQRHLFIEKQYTHSYFPQHGRPGRAGSIFLPSSPLCTRLDLLPIFQILGRWLGARVKCACLWRDGDGHLAQEDAGAAEVLELLHHADSCDLDAARVEPATFTGAILPRAPATPSAPPHPAP